MSDMIWYDLIWYNIYIQVSDRLNMDFIWVNQIGGLVIDQIIMIVVLKNNPQ